MQLGGNIIAQFADQNVGNGIAVNFSGFSLNGTAAGNYILDVHPTVYQAITPRSLSLSGLSSADKMYDGTNIAQVLGTALLGNFMAGDDVALTGTAFAQFADKNVGNGIAVSFGGLSLTGAQAGNYVLDNHALVYQAITPRLLSLSGLYSADKIYDGSTAAQALGTAVLGNQISGDDVALTGTASAQFADKNVGNNIAVSFGGLSLTGAQAGNYLLDSHALVYQAITPRLLSLSGLFSADKIYDGTNTAQVLGNAVLGNQISGDDVALTGTANAQYADKNVGNGIAVSFGGLSLTGAQAGNYVLDSHALVYQAITPRLLSLSGLYSADKIYDGTNTAQVLGTALLGNQVSGDDVALTGAASAQFADKNVGNGIAVSFGGLSLTGAAAGNYALDSHALVYQAITPRLLSLSGLYSADKIYDGTNSAQVLGTALLSNQISGDDVGLGGTAVAQFADKNVGNGIAVSFGGLSLTGAQAGNYLLDSHALVYQAITPRLLSLSGLYSADKIYDGTNTAQVLGTALLGNQISGDDIALTGAASAQFADKNVGNGIAVSFAGLSLTGAQAGNYMLDSHALVYQAITPRLLSLSGLYSADKIYDGTNTAQVLGTALLGNQISGDDVALTGAASAQFADKNVGNGIAVSFGGLSLTGVAAGNYMLDSHALVYQAITPRLLSLSGLYSADKIYDGTNTAQVLGTAVLGNVVAGDDLSLDGMAVAHFADKNVGSAIAISFGGLTLGGSAASNYILDSHALAYQAITPRLLSLSGLYSADKIYDGNTAAQVLGTALIGNQISGDDVALTGTASAQFADRNAGNAVAVSFSGLSLTGAAAGNYILDSHAPVYQAITPRLLQISGLSSADKIYDGNTAAQVLGMAVLGNFIVGDDVALTGIAQAQFNSRNVTEASRVSFSGLILQGGDAGNYILGDAPDVAAHILARPLLVHYAGGDKIYDGNNLARLILQDDRIAGDALSISYDAFFADKNVGSDKNIMVRNVVLSGADAANYSLNAPEQWQADISQRATVSWIGGSSGNWLDAANWQDGAVPDGHNVAYVEIGAGAWVRLATDAEIFLDGLSGAGALEIDKGQLSLGYAGLHLGGLHIYGGQLRSTGDLEVTQDFDQSGGTIWVAGQAQFGKENGDLHMGNMNVGGDISVSSRGGAVLQLADSHLIISGSTHIMSRNGGAPADIYLAQSGNIFGGPLWLDGRTVEIASQSALQLAALVASNDAKLTTTGGAVTQTGAMQIGGRLSVDTGSGDVILMNPGNRFSGPVQLRGGMVQSNDAATRGLFRIAEIRPTDAMGQAMGKDCDSSGQAGACGAY